MGIKTVEFAYGTETVDSVGMLEKPNEAVVTLDWLVVLVALTCPTMVGMEAAEPVPLGKISNEVDGLERSEVLLVKADPLECE